MQCSAHVFLSWFMFLWSCSCASSLHVRFDQENAQEEHASPTLQSDLDLPERANRRLSMHTIGFTTKNGSEISFPPHDLSLNDTLKSDMLIGHRHAICANVYFSWYTTSSIEISDYIELYTSWAIGSLKLTSIYWDRRSRDTSHPHKFGWRVDIILRKFEKKSFDLTPGLETYSPQHLYGETNGEVGTWIRAAVISLRTF